MSIKNARVLASAGILLTPIVIVAATAFRWRTGNCAAAAHESVLYLMAFAAMLVATKNPYRAIAACLAYLPIGYIFATEPCTAPRSQGAGGFIYLLSPIFVVFIVVGAFAGGAILRAVLGIKPEPS